MDNKRVMIFSTKESEYFAKLIAKGLGLKMGQIERRVFGGGERWYRFKIEKRDDLVGKTVILVGSTHTDKAMLELYDLGCAAMGYGARRVIYAKPFLGYSTMERAKKPGEVVTGKSRLRIFSAIPNGGLGNVFLLLDLHAAGLPHYYEGNCLRFELKGSKILSNAIRREITKRKIMAKDLVFGSVDMGRAEIVTALAKEFGAGIALIDKDREFEKTKVRSVIGKVRNKHVIMPDDMTRSGGSALKAGEAYLARGAKSVSAVFSHLALNSKKVLDELLASKLGFIIALNSHPSVKLIKGPQFVNRIMIEDASGLFVDIIKKVIK